MRDSAGCFRVCSAAMILALAYAISPTAHAQSPAPAACTALMNAKLPDTKIVKAEQYAAGEFHPPAGPLAAVIEGAKSLPALCRVVAEITPTSDSAIKMELWMPVEHWNGRFRGQGNGGFAGDISYESIGVSVLGGYASAGTDTGHSASFIDASWAKGHPEKIADFGYRAIHLMTLRSKDLVAAYYGTPAKHSYFAACSDGGREALMEAQRFPADYDGILAGAPAYNWTALVSSGMNNEQALLKPDGYIPTSKLPLISNAVLAACDKQDGVADGIINDPAACHFHPATLECKADAKDANSCLTAAQIKTLEVLYSGGHTRDGSQFFPGYAVGGEADPGGWGPWVVGESAEKSLGYGFANGFFRNMVFDEDKAGPGSFDVKTSSVDEAYKASTAKMAADLNATDPNLAPFFTRGGKLILYHGWSDAAISPFSTINYYRKVEATTGKKAVDDSLRLYMVPGMDHCSAGPGTDVFGQFGWLPSNGPDDAKHDAYLALEQWAEGAKAPVEIVAARRGDDGALQMTRPLCPYPEISKYKGTGDTNDAANFSCVANNGK